MSLKRQRLRTTFGAETAALFSCVRFRLNQTAGNGKCGTGKWRTKARKIPGPGEKPWCPDVFLPGTVAPLLSGTYVHQPILEHQIRFCAPSSVISRPTSFSGSLRCYWQVGSAPFVRRRCDCSASSAPFTNIQTYLLTYGTSHVSHSDIFLPLCCQQNIGLSALTRTLVEQQREHPAYKNYAPRKSYGGRGLL